VIAAAILDRLLHHSITINIKGESYHLCEKLKAGLLPAQAQARRRPRQRRRRVIREAREPINTSLGGDSDDTWGVTFGRCLTAARARTRGAMS
jgi:hypothetical protein